MLQYHELLEKILESGISKPDRTGTGTRSIFGHQMRFNLSHGFPLLTTKKIHFPSVAHELIWFLSGSKYTDYLKGNGVSIWDEWASVDGYLGPIYGYQWRCWPSGDGFIDQIAEVQDILNTDPNSRRMLVSAWNVSMLNEMALHPCHVMFQLYVAGGKLSIHVYQRSCDVFLGVPFNIASYALLCMMFAHVHGFEYGDLIWTGGDCHLYNNHLDQAQLQLTRGFRNLPQVKFIGTSGISDICNITYDHISLEDYNPWPLIKADVSV